MSLTRKMGYGVDQKIVSETGCVGSGRQGGDCAVAGLAADQSLYVPSADSVIPYSQGRKLYDLAPQPKRFIPVEDAGHTDLIDALGKSRYQEMLLSFVRDPSGIYPAASAARSS